MRSQYRVLLGDTGLEALAELGDRVELGRHLREVVVGVGELALLDRLHDDGDLDVLAGVLTAERLGDEGRGAVGLETEDGLARVQAEMDAVVDAAVEAARAAAPPALEEAYEHVYRD